MICFIWFLVYFLFTILRSWTRAAKSQHNRTADILKVTWCRDRSIEFLVARNCIGGVLLFILLWLRAYVHARRVSVCVLCAIRVWHLSNGWNETTTLLRIDGVVEWTLHVSRFSRFDFADRHSNWIKLVDVVCSTIFVDFVAWVKSRNEYFSKWILFTGSQNKRTELQNRGKRPPPELIDTI